MQDDGTIAQFQDHVEIMTGDNARMMESLKQGDQLTSGMGIKSIGWFIKHQNLRQH